MTWMAQILKHLVRGKISSKPTVEAISVVIPAADWFGGGTGQATGYGRKEPKNKLNNHMLADPQAGRRIFPLSHFPVPLPFLG
jgi:hypothetical protein